MIARIREELGVNLKSLGNINAILEEAYDLTRTTKLKSKIAAAVEIVSDAINTSSITVQEFDKRASLPRTNTLSSMEESWAAINLCLFLFEQIDNIPVDDIGYESNVHSFAIIGKRIASAADEAARLALGSVSKESGHD